MYSQTPYPAGTRYFSESDQLAGFSLVGSPASVAKVPSSGPGFSEAWRLATLADKQNPWDVQLIRNIPGAVAKNDVAFVRFYARAIETTQETGGASLVVYAQKGSADYDKSLSQELFLTTDWQEYMIPFTWTASYGASQAQIVLGAGFKRQLIEIGGFDTISYGTTLKESDLPRSKSTYVGREPTALWRAAAAARIEQHRKGAFTVEVTDSLGNPVAGATIKVRMQRHAFEFGTAVVATRLVEPSSENTRYRRILLENFNAAGPENDLKALAWQGDWGPGFNQDKTLSALSWLRDHQFTVRGHVLVWPGWSNLPKSITDLKGTANQSTIPNKVLQHIENVVKATREYLAEWDVLNEPFANHDLMDLFGKQIQVDWFKKAREHHPSAKLFLNDYGNDNILRDPAHIAHFEETANYLKANNAPITGIGLQAHMGGNPTPPEALVATLDRYATTIGLPVRITEFDINTRDEEMQADYTRDFYTAAFSHPSTVGIQMWGFWESEHWFPAAAMYRADWSPKPAALAYRKLVFEEWWTNLDGNTDGAGRFSGRGFFGDYIITVEHSGKRFEKRIALSPGSPSTFSLPLSSPKLVNLSTRAPARSGNETLIGGFTVRGEGKKRILIRGVGPALGDFGLSGQLAKPSIKLYSGETLLATRLGWDQSGDGASIAEAASAAGAFALKPASPDAALIATLASGGYSLHVTGSDGGTGIALFEAYEFVENEPANLVNLSTRAFAGKDANIAIAGFVIKGVNSRRILVRGVGPGLQAFNVSGVLARPYLTLVKGDKVIAANGGWEANTDAQDLVNTSQRVGAFALAPGSADSAIVRTLDSGQYSVLVRGADGGTGVVLVEIYDAGS
ncbi:MAG: endo-1,4-beta-xylanase [Opitutaceae bacterium]|nr:endo-1,4-beta-xylanase [Opitutaceae bacterium]